MRDKIDSDSLRFQVKIIRGEAIHQESECPRCTFIGILYNKDIRDAWDLYQCPANHGGRHESNQLDNIFWKYDTSIGRLRGASIILQKDCDWVLYPINRTMKELRTLLGDDNAN